MTIGDFFSEQVAHAFEERRVKSSPLTATYLVKLLEHYAFSKNFERPMLAELYLQAVNTEQTQARMDLLKKLGDLSLYISGFFGDSLNRKVVDIDYYVGMGGTAYGNLARLNEANSPVYQEFSERFMDFVDVLTYISQQSLIQTDADLLRLYDRYMVTGSRLAEEQLIKKGLLQVGQTTTKQQKQ